MAVSWCGAILGVIIRIITPKSSGAAGQRGALREAERQEREAEVHADLVRAMAFWLDRRDALSAFDAKQRR